MAPNKSSVLQTQGLYKRYGQLDVLFPTDFALEDGVSAAIVGPSGSGKTTFLSLCAGLDAPSGGELWLCGQPLHEMDEEGRAALRNQDVGFVFQHYRLITSLTALENVMVPLELQGKRQASQTARELLKDVGLGDRLDHYPTQLSGGEQQRVALARAFVTRPRILFADEPTGNLDYDTGQKIIELLFALNASAGTTLLLVTHDPVLARRTQQAYRLTAGRMDLMPAA